MSIPSDDYLKQRNLYTRNNVGVWKIVAYCDSPTITMENITTGDRETFGIGGLTAQNFDVVGELPLDFFMHQACKERMDNK